MKKVEHRHLWKRLNDNMTGAKRVDYCEKCNLIRRLIKPKTWSKGYVFKGDYVKPKIINYDIYEYSKNGYKVQYMPSCDMSNKEYRHMKNHENNVNIFEILKESNGL